MRWREDHDVSTRRELGDNTDWWVHEGLVHVCPNWRDATPTHPATDAELLTLRLCGAIQPENTP